MDSEVMESTTPLTNEEVLQTLSQQYMECKGKLSEVESQRKNLRNQLQQLQGACNVLSQIIESNKPVEEVEEEEVVEEVKTKKGFRK